MTDKTPQEEMAEKMSNMIAARAGRPRNRTMSEMIQDRKTKLEGGLSIKKRESSLRRIITGTGGGEAGKVAGARRKEQLSKLDPGKRKMVHWKDK